jgi:hypothetical protein
MEKASDYYCVMNVGNIREFVVGIQASRDMLESMEGYDGEAWLEDWCMKHFGEMGIPAYEAYQAYFNSFVTDDLHGTPLLLDGLSKGRARNNLNLIKAGLENITASQGGFDGLQLDAFRKSLARAYPGRQMDPVGWLAKASLQDSLLQQARVLTEEVSSRLTGESKTFLENNLGAHILFMQCLTGWVVETTKALLAFESKDQEATREHLEDALDKFALFEEAVGRCSRGKWEQWYRGEKKINVKSLRNANETVLGMLTD